MWHWVYSIRIMVNIKIILVAIKVISKYTSQLISSAKVPYYYHDDQNDQ